MTAEEQQAAMAAEAQKTYAVRGNVRATLLGLLDSIRSAEDGRMVLGGVQAKLIGVLSMALEQSPELPAEPPADPPKE